jgi:hypothetical protein
MAIHGSIGLAILTATITYIVGLRNVQRELERSVIREAHKINNVHFTTVYAGLDEDFVNNDRNRLVRRVLEIVEDLGAPATPGEQKDRSYELTHILSILSHNYPFVPTVRSPQDGSGFPEFVRQPHLSFETAEQVRQWAADISAIGIPLSAVPLRHSATLSQLLDQKVYPIILSDTQPSAAARSDIERDLTRFHDATIVGEFFHNLGEAKQIRDATEAALMAFDAQHNRTPSTLKTYVWVIYCAIALAIGVLLPIRRTPSRRRFEFWVAPTLYAFGIGYLIIEILR